jgi:signal transduction histidine kinase
LLALINDVLEMSKIEAGQIFVHETTFDLYSLLDNIREMLQLKAEMKKLQLLFEWPDDLPQQIQTDKVKLRQILINLLGNALKFTQQGSVKLKVNHQQTDEGDRLQSKRS